MDQQQQEMAALGKKLIIGGFLCIVLIPVWGLIVTPVLALVFGLAYMALGWFGVAGVFGLGGFGLWYGVTEYRERRAMTAS